MNIFKRISIFCVLVSAFALNLHGMEASHNDPLEKAYPRLGFSDEFLERDLNKCVTDVRVFMQQHNSRILSSDLVPLTEKTASLVTRVLLKKICIVALLEDLCAFLYKSQLGEKNIDIVSKIISTSSEEIAYAKKVGFFYSLWFDKQVFIFKERDDFFIQKITFVLFEDITKAMRNRQEIAKKERAY